MFSVVDLITVKNFSSIDYDVQLWDFAGMDASMRSFRTLRPCESHVIRSLEFSSTGDKLLVVPGSAQVNCYLHLSTGIGDLTGKRHYDLISIC